MTHARFGRWSWEIGHCREGREEARSARERAGTRKALPEPTEFLEKAGHAVGTSLTSRLVASSSLSSRERGVRREERQSGRSSSRHPNLELLQALHPFGQHDRMVWAPVQSHLIVMRALRMQGGTRFASKSPIGWGCNLTKFGPSQRSIKSEPCQAPKKPGDVLLVSSACTGRSRDGPAPSPSRPVVDLVEAQQRRKERSRKTYRPDPRMRAIEFLVRAVATL